MRAWLNQRLATLIQKAKSDYRHELGPDLCSEVYGLDVESAVATTVELLRGWKRNLLLCHMYRGSQWRGVLITVDEIEPILRGAVVDEKVYVFIDLVTMGGCGVDFSPDGPGTVEMMLTAWGAREDTAEELARRLGGSGTFRGNWAGDPALHWKNLPYREPD